MYKCFSVPHTYSHSFPLLSVRGCGPHPHDCPLPTPRRCPGGWRKAPRPGQAQPAGLGATFEALAGAKEPTEAVRIQLGEALRACRGHLLRPKVHEHGARLGPALTPKADSQQGMCLGRPKGLNTRDGHVRVFRPRGEKGLNLLQKVRW